MYGSERSGKRAKPDAQSAAANARAHAGALPRMLLPSALPLTLNALPPRLHPPQVHTPPALHTTSSGLRVCSGPLHSAHAPSGPGTLVSTRSVVGGENN